MRFLRPFQQYVSHIKKDRKVIMCNRTPYTVEKNSVSDQIQTQARKREEMMRLE